ncbi:MAG: signal peptidase II [Azoarcus sp.]|jgi:signal peptidase II|nr:signal peptidase II [Azoarcus sp.]
MPDRRADRRAIVFWLALIVLVVVLDQVTKEWMQTHFQLTCSQVVKEPQLVYGKQIEVTDFFNLVLACNEGAAFSFLSEYSGWQRWFFAVLAIVVSIWLLVLTWQHRFERLQPCAFSLIIGGAIGNVIDRFNHGAVVDFLSFHAGPYYWPAFNIADSAIVLGVGLMLIAHFCARPPPENAT